MGSCRRMRCSVVIGALSTTTSVALMLKFGILHPTLGPWAYFTNLLMWSPLSVSVPAVLEHHESHTKAHRTVFLLCVSVWLLSLA